ncbi:Integrin beta-1, partial [Halocaridina rubra]
MNLAGLVVPNDEKCHLNADAEYYAYKKFDYPSIGQINKVSQEKDIFIIFAVSGYESQYNELSRLLRNSVYAKLSNDSSNIVDIVREQYEKISSKVVLTDNSSKAVAIQYSSNCKDTSAQPTNTSECTEIRENDQVTFTLDIELKDCPDGKDKEVVEVKTLEDSLILEIELQCQCDCAKEANYTIPIETCSNNGSLACGVCNCFEGFRGEQCECSSGTDDGNDGSMEMKCKANVTDDELCSGHGNCKCGKCNCDKKWSGTYCQCDQSLCYENGGEICSGNGECPCNKCECDSGYEGTQCQCQNSEACKEE